MKITKFVSTVSALALALGIAAVQAAPGGNGKGPRPSVDVFNACEVVGPDADGNSAFNVTSTVTDTSDDDPDVPAEVTAKEVDFLAQGRGGPRNATVLATQTFEGGVIPETVSFALCDDGALIDLPDGTRALNAEVRVTVNEERIFTSRCDDIPDTDVDESAIDLDSTQIFCNGVQVNP